MQIIRRITFIIAVLINGQAISGSMNKNILNMPKENLYFGIGVGGTFNKDTLDTLSDNSRISKSINHSDVNGNISLGYGHTFANALFLSVEANTYFPRRTTTVISPALPPDDNLFYENQIAFDDYLGLDLLSGYRLNSLLLFYGRAGLSFRDLSINQNPTNTSVSFFNSGNSVGGRFGLGFSYALSPNFAASVDYFYTYHPTWSSYWRLYSLQFNTKSYANYAGISLIVKV
ncbi:outer membrane protein [Legionella cardiaca]|uniref:Outer membrane beta-barrel protein n=1 Tax=Legionella cardiaca TaxID=1071983 RepID=A0ABY8AT11_9GAMM|nr:outer membrane beta-barrel protein [Legionella cardiaca]WED42916.1 outer membrane beta-barrel protein [Legionella cardiaca]